MIVCDWWVCKHKQTCKERLSFMKTTPCAFCHSFDSCDVCEKFVECAAKVTQRTPDMFRRLVREINLSEDRDRTEQEIRRRTRRRKNKGSANDPI